MRQETVEALVIGAGPAGLMAADALAGAGHRVIVAEAKPSPARKFLMAGKSGLNLTKDEDAAGFAAHFSTSRIAPMLAGFGPGQVMEWARGLGQEVFIGTSGRVFPVAMKGSPLLRGWLARLAGQGVALRMRWRCTGTDAGAFTFETPEGAVRITARRTVLALGGASWPRLGSDAAWVPWLQATGVRVAPFRPANMGFTVAWSPHMAAHSGQPVKGVTLIAGSRRVRGECVITARGIEGGGVYAVSDLVRDGADLALDLLPDLAVADVAARLARARPGDSLANRLRKALGLDPVKVALVMEWGRPLPAGQALAALLKTLPVRHAGPRPLAEAISSAGGIRWDSLSADLELTCLPGVFACGEMLDWEAPTGGYLLTGCLATGLWAGRAAGRT